MHSNEIYYLNSFCTNILTVLQCPIGITWGSQGHYDVSRVNMYGNHMDIKKCEINISCITLDNLLL